MNFKFIIILISLIFIFIYIGEFYFVVLVLNWGWEIFILPVISLIVLYLFGYYYYTSNSPIKSALRGYLLLLYSIIFVLLSVYIFSPGVGWPWPYKISVKEILFRSYILNACVLISTWLYDYLLERKVSEEYNVKHQMVVTASLFIIIFTFLLLL